jgi:DnaJ-class molecular chaperone
MKQLDTKHLGDAVEAVLNALAPPVCPTKEEALQVLMHVTAGLLEGRDKAYVASYLVKITEMLGGKFDRESSDACHSCHGHGYLMVGGRSGGGMPAQYGTISCSTCKGTGKIS